MVIFKHSTALPVKQGLQLISGGRNRHRRTERGIVVAQSQDHMLTWSFTTALRETCGHPEILVAGLDPFQAHALMTFVTDSILLGRTFPEGRWNAPPMANLTCVFHRMSSYASSILLPIPNGQQGMQLIYPDHSNRLPWQLGHLPRSQYRQPIFSAGETLGDLEDRYLEAAAQRPIAAGCSEPAAR